MEDKVDIKVGQKRKHPEKYLDADQKEKSPSAMRNHANKLLERKSW